MYLADVFTVSPSLAGIPALSVPSGLSGNGLPIGMQFIGPVDSEPTLFRLAQAVEEWANFSSRLAPGAVA
jgi:aspartyl-tRNA(Asn)/glutamyl-tRNA(Gln) amidotransferase subunit A